MARSASQSSSISNESTGQDGVMGAIRRFWRRSYAADYIGFALLFIAFIVVESTAEPFHRMFYLDDVNLQYPHALVERVSVRYNILYSGLLPFIIILLATFVIYPSRSGSTSLFHKPHVTTLGLMTSIFLTAFLADVIKNAVGRPRPDLISRCNPAKGTPKHELVTWKVCTETDHHTLHDGFRSFPSGHSAFAFSGLGYLSLFLAGQLHIFRPHTDLFRVLLVVAPLVGATMIAISRLEDYRHDVYDVTIGSILGMLIAYFTYRRYYPRLNAQRPHVPYSSPAEKYGMVEIRRAKRKDEEAMVGVACGREESDDSENVPLREASRENDHR
ncbi:MAG: hypothetical protein Q9220_000483 [cf. Caloplaca sp. 1 TL-2023]